MATAVAVTGREPLLVDEPGTAGAVPGDGHRIAVHDTVPFCLWATAKNLDDHEKAFWTIAAVGGGIVAARPGFSSMPPHWLQNLESLPVTR